MSTRIKNVIRRMKGREKERENVSFQILFKVYLDGIRNCLKNINNNKLLKRKRKRNDQIMKIIIRVNAYKCNTQPIGDRSYINDFTRFCLFKDNNKK